MSMKMIFNLAHFLYLFGFIAGALCYAGLTYIRGGGLLSILIGIACLLASMALTFKLEPFLKMIGVTKDDE